ncbi:hypothetical protein ACB092_02G018000 [Castanea dentata]
MAGNICLVEHLQSQHLSIPAALQYKFPEVWQDFWITRDVDG